MDPTKTVFHATNPPTPQSPRKMRATRQRPLSQHGAQAPAQGPAQQGRKIFNCIVDDSALVAGVKRSTRNGIKQWVKSGQIRLFVPLHALEQLSRQKGAPNRHGEDVREALQWLDDATSKYPNVVTLQGADEIYENWEDVEKFAVPRTLFSEYDALDESASSMNDSPEQAMSKLTLGDVIRKTPLSSAASDASGPLSPSSMRSQRSSLSAMSPPTSPIKPAVSPVKPVSGQAPPTPSSSASVPPRLQPLFNYILWRIHQELDPVAALESFIFLCNDDSKVNFAKGFDIKIKRLEHMREAISREDRDFKNRQMVANRENLDSTSADSPVAKSASLDGDNEVAFKLPPKAPAAMLSKQQQQQRPQLSVIDPDAFDRNASVAPYQEPLRSPNRQYFGPDVSRGDMHGPYSPHGHTRGNYRGAPRGRGNHGASRRGGVIPNNRADGVASGAQIDPNSFVRPRSNGYTGRGGRKLWVPT